MFILKFYYKSRIFFRYGEFPKVVNAKWEEADNSDNKIGVFAGQLWYHHVTPGLGLVLISSLVVFIRIPKLHGSSFKKLYTQVYIDHRCLSGSLRDCDVPERGRNMEFLKNT